MKTAMKRSGRASSVPGGLAMASGLSMGFTVLFSAAIALCLDGEQISWQQAGYWIMAMLFTVSFLGGKCAYACIKRQRLMVSLMSGVLYWAILLCVTALFFGGDYSAVGETLAIIGAGSGTSALLRMPAGKKYRRKPGESMAKLNKKGGR